MQAQIDQNQIIEQLGMQIKDLVIENAALKSALNLALAGGASEEESE